MTTPLTNRRRSSKFLDGGSGGFSWKHICNSLFGSCGCISEIDNEDRLNHYSSASSNENESKRRHFSFSTVKHGVPVEINSTTLVYGERADEQNGEPISFFSRVQNCCRRHVNQLSKTSMDIEGQRIIPINDRHAVRYASNITTTAKYTFFSFLPTFLYEQFRRYSNLFFLAMVILQQIPGVSPTGRYITLFPLSFILIVSAVKEIHEDMKRHRADTESNKREVTVLKDRLWIKQTWADLCVGDIVKITDEQYFPADLILLTSSKPDGICFIQTANLDGETNLKIKQALPETMELVNEEALAAFHGTIECEPPNRRIYDFLGILKRAPEEPVPLGPSQFLQRGAALAHTDWIHGIVIYTGHETKLMKNYARAPLKTSSVDMLLNKQIISLFTLFLILVGTSSIMHLLWKFNNYEKHTYLNIIDAFASKDIVFTVLTFLILFNNFIPISLQVTLEMVRLFQAIFINSDINMYHMETDTPALARTSNLNEELGMVQYVLTDKTGTLTCNVMEFKKCTIAGIIYEVSDRAEDSQLVRNLREGHPTAFVIEDFMLTITLCHSVISEVKRDGTIVYHATNPDDYAIIQGARSYGFEFITRSGDYIDIFRLGSRERYKLLQVLEFTSSRKRMSVIVRSPSGNIRLYCKGADSVIFERLSDELRDYYEVTKDHLSDLAAAGFRTLCCARRDLSEDEYQDWIGVYRIATTALIDREERMERIADQIEQNFTLLGATAIEDKLQDGVAETIQAILEADIRIWMLTGDKQETAINIGFSSGLLHQSMKLVLINEESLRGTFRALRTFFATTKSYHTVAMVIDGKTLQYALSKSVKDFFQRICLKCRVVICCRLSPMQKGEITELVNSSGACTLAIGDGANDVAMIRKAKVGVGISGTEGLQAACASDYSIAQFRYLRRLLLVHGTWNYRRITTLIQYAFYKNICMCIIQLWYNFYNGWSAQILFDPWSIAGYNIFFTAMPPMIIGIFDKVCSSETLLKYPRIYSRAHNAQLFNVSTFCVWILNAFLHSLLLFWIPIYIFAVVDSIWPHGRSSDLIVIGTTVYTGLVVTVSLKAGLTLRSWNYLTHLAIWGSILLWGGFIVAYSYFWPILYMGADFCRLHEKLFSSAVFWLLVVLVPLITLLPDFFIKVFFNTHFMTITEVARRENRKAASNN